MLIKESESEEESDDDEPQASKPAGGEEVSLGKVTAAEKSPFDEP